MEKRTKKQLQGLDEKNTIRIPFLERHEQLRHATFKDGRDLGKASLPWQVALDVESVGNAAVMW